MIAPIYFVCDVSSNMEDVDSPAIILRICTHTDAWDKSRRNVMILTQILSTLRQDSQFPTDATANDKTRATQKLLTHLTHTLYHSPQQKQLGAQVIAAVNLGTVVSVSEAPQIPLVAVAHNNRENDGFTHAFRVVEVVHPARTAEQIVEDEYVDSTFLQFCTDLFTYRLATASLTEHVGDVLKAMEDVENPEAAENLVAFRSLSWIRARLKDKRIFVDTDPPPRHILAVLPALLPPIDT
ncbi:hypothetical protein B0H19DRAFT_651002 [Mycena capillaripes]|nr:hypothetical protein B0H19DRAFT_651002 [Mycena capillaripes]